MKNYVCKNRSVQGGDVLEIGGEIKLLPGAKVEGLPADAAPAATTAARGTVKMAAKVAEAAGSAPTAAEFKALLDALKAAGIMSST